MKDKNCILASSKKTKFCHVHLHRFSDLFWGYFNISVMQIFFSLQTHFNCHILLHISLLKRAEMCELAKKQHGGCVPHP